MIINKKKYSVLFKEWASNLVKRLKPYFLKY